MCKKTCIFHHCRAVTKIHSCTVCTWYIAKQLCTYKLTLIISLFSLQINFDLIIMIFNVRIWNEMLTISVCLARHNFIVSKSCKSYLSCDAFWEKLHTTNTPQFIYVFFIKNSENLMKKCPSLKRKIFVPGEWNWIEFFTYT